MNVAITTDIRIWTRYDRYATSEPTSTLPLFTSRPPIQSTAMLARLMSRFTVGNIPDISRPPRSDTTVRSVLADSNRSDSCGSRTKARTTRIPVICSRRTRFTWSIRSCMRRNAGTMNATIVPRMIAAAGIAMTRTIERPTSSRTARITPTTIVIGAVIAIVHAMTTSICTCCTSFVMRVMSDGAPKNPVSRAEKSVTRWYRLLRRSRPALIATLPPRYTPETAKTNCTNAKHSITPPHVQM